MTLRQYVGSTLAVCLLGCSSPANDRAEAGGGAGTDGAPSMVATQAELTRAHRDSLARIITPAVEALAVDQPVRSGAAGVTPLAGPGWFGTRRTTAQEALSTLLTEARGIDSARLEPEDAQVLLGLRFALERAKRHADEPSMSYDPTWITRNVGDLLTELEHRHLASACTEASCVAPLRDAVFGLQGARQGLKRSSSAAMRGALDDLQALDDRARRLQRSVEAAAPAGADHSPAMTRTVEALRAEIDRVRKDWETRRDGLGDLPQEPWSTLSQRRPPTHNFRLPDTLDHRVLRRVLGREEHVEDDSRSLLESARRNLARLAAMKSLVQKPEPSPPTVLSVRRCETLLARLNAAVKAARPAPVSCEAIAAMQGPTKVSDDEALLLLLDHSVVRPERRKRQASQPAHVRLVAGEMAPRAHRWISLIGHAHAAALPAVEVRAIDGATLDLCRASAALLRHGAVPLRARRRGEPHTAVEVHTRDTARTWLEASCPGVPEAALWTFAATNTWEAIFGGGMVLLNKEPYVMAGLDAFWWTPLGLTISFAVPEPKMRGAAQPRSTPSDAGGVTVSVEDL